jgi:hypothetical protein
MSFYSRISDVTVCSLFMYQLISYDRMYDVYGNRNSKSQAFRLDILVWALEEACLRYCPKVCSNAIMINTTSSLAQNQFTLAANYLLPMYLPCSGSVRTLIVTYSSNYLVLDARKQYAVVSQINWAEKIAISLGIRRGMPPLLPKTSNVLEYVTKLCRSNS